MRKLLPQSLRSRLILAFGILIFVSLFLAGATTAYLLKSEQEKTARERVARLADPVAYFAAYLQAAGFSDPGVIQRALEEEFLTEDSNVRILLVDTDGKVEGDSEQTLRGQTIAQLAARGIEARPLDGITAPRISRYRGPENLVLFTRSRVAVVRLPGSPVAFVPKYQGYVAVDRSEISQAWRELMPRLFFAGGIALLVGVVSASLLARSISRPLREITAASEAMARGNYDQHIPEYGGDEVGRLARAFNNMANQVSRSHRTLREFLANVSHELKTPLTSVQGFSQAMVEGALHDPEDYAEAARIINDEAVRMRGLVDDLLYLSQVEAGQVVLHDEAVNPMELLRSTAERFRRRAELAGVKLEVEPGPAPVLHADSRRLEQALANLVDNAVRHTPSGGRIRLGLETSDGSLRLSVHNTGSYIPAEVMPHIFDRFFQVDRERSRADGNTGLGLAITREIVEAHGGRVSATSSPEEGTEFVIAMPLSRGAPEKSSDEAEVR
ncbi:MAG TPA: HAMP domain-containing sensor histidine kinase [Dehalococcoidia bacterium]|nr:HAMP domain-containing sensor histidine kinase [Dehalococcoidia bacterium]